MKKVLKIKGVEEIFNEIEIGPSNSLSEKTEDFIFEVKINNRLLLEPGIYSNNYNVDVVNGNVYVMGVSSDIEEKTKIEKFLNSMDDIKRLFLFVDTQKTIKNVK